MILSTSATMRPGPVAAAAPGAPRWFQVYVFRDRAVTQALIDEACEHGYSALVLTVDVADPRPPRGRRPERLPHSGRVRGRGRHLRRHRPERQLARRRVDRRARAARRAQGRADDGGRAARRRARRGGVVVSNHGGRQLDGVPASIDALSRVVEASTGVPRCSWTAAFAAASTCCARVALGAQAVLVGRPVVYALAVGGEEGVVHVLRLAARRGGARAAAARLHLRRRGLAGARANGARDPRAARRERLQRAAARERRRRACRAR